VMKLRYLEFRGVYIGLDYRNFLDFLTKRRPALEIVFEYNEHAVLIWDMARTPLSRVPAISESNKVKAEADEEEVEDDDQFGYDDEFG
jgi:hypothetical protein